jgi:diguanylate cyclase (GGDEF)-like protein
MRQYVQKLGRTKTVFAITFFSILTSLLLSYIIYIFLKLTGFHIQLSIMLITAFIIPLIVAPLASWHTIGLLFTIDKLEKKMRHLATFDSLTGLLSRALFLHDADNYLHLARRQKSNLAFLLIDIDDFKNINDNFGHLAGDKVLIRFAKLIRTKLRENDLSGRLGGEEFGIVLYDISEEEAVKMTENLQTMIRDLQVPYENEKIRFTVSIGISIFEFDTKETLYSILKKADKALYNAKHTCKDCTVVYSSAL